MKPRITQLTRRERQIANLVAEGFTRKQIGAMLGVGPECVSFHVRRATRRLGLDQSRDPRVLLTRLVLGAA